MTKMRLLTLALLLIAGLAATAQASHTESLVLNADCDGFNAEGVLVLSSYIGTGDMEVAVEALNDGVVVASGTATFHIESRIVEGNPFTFEGVWDVAPEGATEAVFLMTLHSQGWLSLNETHNLAMECIMDDCQVRRPAWWYRHPDAWPVDELEIGGCTLNKCQIRNLMTGCWGRRVAKRLFRHTVAAMLNDLACGGAPADVVVEANAFLGSHPRHQNLNRAARREARALKNLLREFNRRDVSNKAAPETDPEWDDSTETITWDEVKDMFR